MTTACKLKSVSALVPLTATKDINYFSNKPYAVINVHHRDKTHITPMRAGAQPGDTVEFELPKVFDYFGRMHLQTKFNAWAAPVPRLNANDPCFVEGAGYRLIDNVQINFTNKRITSSVVPYWWAILLNAFNRDISYRTFNAENQGTNSGSQANRRNWLLNGYTFLSEIESGFQHHSRENYIMISVLSSRLNIKINLAPTGALVQGFSGTPTNQPNPWIANNGLTLVVESLHLNPHERKRELDRHEEGLFNLLRVFTTQTDVIPLGSTSYTLNLNMTGAYEVAFFIFKPTIQLSNTSLATNDPCLLMPADSVSPQALALDAGAAPGSGFRPAYFSNNATVSSQTDYYLPDEWEFKLQNNPIVNRERTWLNLTVDRQHHFPGCVTGPNGVVVLHMSETFQHDNNAILGHIDFNTASQRQAFFYWTLPGHVSSKDNATASGIDVNGTLSIITIACGPDFAETIQGQMHAVFGL